MVKIGHAVCDENGKNGKEGCLPGNQTGKELRFQNWYKREGGWDCYIECPDTELADKAATIMERIISSPLYGYNQAKRWDGYNAIVKAKGDILGSDGGDFDCSSLCISAYVLAGLNIKPNGYTGNIDRVFKSAGFRVYTDYAHTGSCEYAQRGGMYVAKGHHVCMALENGSKKPETSKYVRVKGSVNVREEPVSGKRIKIARNTLLPYLGTEQTSGWYIVSVGDANGYITNNPRYTTLCEV